jgi:hypothetical protein
MPETNKREYAGQHPKMVPGSTVKLGRQAVGKGKGKIGTRGLRATGGPKGWTPEQTLKSFTQLPPVKRWPKKGK